VFQPKEFSIRSTLQTSEKMDKSITQHYKQSSARILQISCSSEIIPEFQSCQFKTWNLLEDLNVTRKTDSWLLVETKRVLISQPSFPFSLELLQICFHKLVSPFCSLLACLQITPTNHNSVHKSVFGNYLTNLVLGTWIAKMDSFAQSRSAYTLAEGNRISVLVADF
jgi:hypothetical protein